MNVLTHVEKFLYETPRHKLIAAILAIILFRTGIWAMPNLFVSQAVAQDPFTNPFRDPMYHYMCWSWLSPYLAWLTGATGGVSFFLLHFLFSVGFTALFISLLFKKFPERDARTSLVLFSTLPVSATAYFWVGMDSLTLFLMTLSFWLGRFPFLALLCGIGIGMQHFEQGFVGASAVLGALFLSRSLDDEKEYSLKWSSYLLSGVIAGKLVLTAIFHSQGMEVNSGRSYYLSQTWPILMVNFLTHMHVVLWAALGLGWFIVLRHAEFGRKSLAFLLPIILLLFLLPVSDDQTRVFSNTSFLLIAVYALLDGKFISSISGKTASWLFVLWIAVPWIWAWQGRAMWSVFPHDLIYILQKALGLLPQLSIDYFFPFR